MGSGKDYIAANFIYPFITKVLNKSVVRLSFADQLKVNVVVKNDVAFEEVFLNKTEKTRQLLQEEGTDNGRRSDPNIWVKYFDTWVKAFESKGVDAVIVSDVRFRNEIDYIRSHNGLVFKVSAPMRNENRLTKECNNNPTIYNKIKNHSSECDLDDISHDKYDIVLDNDTDEIDDKIINVYQAIREKLT